MFFGFFLSKNENYWNYDTYVYHNVAKMVANGHGIKNMDGSNHFYRVPGYSLFLSFFYKLFNDTDIKNFLWVQVFFASFIPVLLFILSLILFSTDLLLAKLVSIFSIFHLGYILFSGLALTESFFTIFFLLFCILFLPNLHLFFCLNFNLNIKLKKMFLAGIFLGIASLIRPVGHHLIIGLLFLLLTLKNDWRKKLKLCLFLFSGWFLIVFGWLLRNWLLTGYIFFHTLPGIHFLKHSAAIILMKANQCDYVTSLNFLTKQCDDIKAVKEQKKINSLNAIEYCNVMQEVSLNCFFSYPFLTVQHFLINIFKTCFSLYSAELLFIDSVENLPKYDLNRSWKNIFLRFLIPNTSNKFFIFLIYMEILFFVFLWIGFLGFVVNSFFDFELLCLLVKTVVISGILIFLTIACGFARLRLPIEPFLIILSFKFWVQFFFRKKRVLWMKS
ncbi:hypothetical protein GF322_01830 [Candidatus Dependentiae bacterium]|nr:hypothetical protein [Candidatus Dependentiae bacterium]